MREYNNVEITTMSLDIAVTELSNDVYEGARLIELLEGHKKIRGNGHHIRQKIAKYAEDLLKERWV